MKRGRLYPIAVAVQAEVPSRAEDHLRRAATARRVYYLRDACAALQLSLLAYRHCRCSTHSPSVAVDIEVCASDLAKKALVIEDAPLSSSPTCDFLSDAVEPLPASWFYIGLGAVDGARVYIVLPTYTDYFFDYTMHWARIAYSEMARQCVSYGLIAKLQSVGGGWASLHRADKSLVCALQLHAVAQAVRDEELVHKCRLFIGWAHLWNSDASKALEIFHAELEAARRRGHTAHERRCLHAIENAEHNPLLTPGGLHTGHYPMVDAWRRGTPKRGACRSSPLPH
ncbi:hypothetical protein LSCM1_06010 [Leishmania martiniquensis]|uniref:Uncharacterized protein n=1 Tax=Leishmania martiniquensis TaxID=1580590 RepID=A0A836H332_9TRYP|nr:hypothetical protein LSCM1_06010 [Leishmania martiniquensis]